MELGDGGVTELPSHLRLPVTVRKRSAFVLEREHAQDNLVERTLTQRLLTHSMVDHGKIEHPSVVREGTNARVIPEVRRDLTVRLGSHDTGVVSGGMDVEILQKCLWRDQPIAQREF